MPARPGKQKAQRGPVAGPPQDGGCGVWIDTALLRRKRPPPAVVPRPSKQVPRPGARQTGILAFLSKSGGAAGKESRREDGEGGRCAPSRSSAGRWHDGSDDGASDKTGNSREFVSRCISSGSISDSNDRSGLPLSRDVDSSLAIHVAESRSELINPGDPAAVSVRTETLRQGGNAAGAAKAAGAANVSSGLGHGRAGRFDASDIDTQHSDSLSPPKAQSASRPHSSPKIFPKRPFDRRVSPGRPTATAADLSDPGNSSGDSENLSGDSENGFCGDGASYRTAPAGNEWEDSDGSLAALFTQDTQGARVIAHRQRPQRGQGLAEPLCPRERARERVLQALDGNVASDCDAEASGTTGSRRCDVKRRRTADLESRSQTGALFTRDSQGNRVIRHGCVPEY